jgi:hypothetical protein
MLRARFGADIGRALAWAERLLFPTMPVHELSAAL